MSVNPAWTPRWPPPPPRPRYGARRLFAAGIGVVVFQLLVIASLGNVFPPPPASHLNVNWSSGVYSCPRNSTANTTLNYTIQYSNFQGPAAYAVMYMLIQGRLVRFWAVYVPAGAFHLEEKGSISMSCPAAYTFQIRQFATVPS